MKISEVFLVQKVIYLTKHDGEPLKTKTLCIDDEYDKAVRNMFYYADNCGSYLYDEIDGDNSIELIHLNRCNKEVGKDYVKYFMKENKYGMKDFLLFKVKSATLVEAD